MSELSAEDRDWLEQEAARFEPRDHPITRALALIDQQAKALGAADELAARVHRLMAGWGTDYLPGDPVDRTIAAFNHFRSTTRPKEPNHDA